MKKEKNLLLRGLAFNPNDFNSLNEMKISLLKNGDPIDRGSCLQVPNIDHHNMNANSVIESVLTDEKNGVLRYKKNNNKQSLAKYVCGDSIGANFYATRQYEPGLVLHLKADISSLVIDGRDFLYTIIPIIIKKETQQKYAKILSQSFGTKIVDYLNSGSKLKDNSRNVLFRLVDYICMDLEIIKAHLKSNVLIKGRHNTNFKSAFGVIGDIKPNDIIKITKSDIDVNAYVDNVISVRDIMKNC
ncbi:hypothetical protein [Halonatronum saccharophilum]|uniref:hypothetical protein n=1 Tax=Halonatronum saccharophilum TaxID=150060 RepID=UPI000485C0B7|nr:hypothetical protein [Halonatronum saccharophilum]